MVSLPFAAEDCCPCVEKLRTVLPLTVGIRLPAGRGATGTLGAISINGSLTDTDVSNTLGVTDDNYGTKLLVGSLLDTDIGINMYTSGFSNGTITQIISGCLRGAAQRGPWVSTIVPHAACCLVSLQVNCRTHRPQKLKCLISLCTNPVYFKCPYSNLPLKP